jgi:hypothetical protein
MGAAISILDPQTMVLQRGFGCAGNTAPSICCRRFVDVIDDQHRFGALLLHKLQIEFLLYGVEDVDASGAGSLETCESSLQPPSLRRTATRQNWESDARVCAAQHHIRPAA